MRKRKQKVAMWLVDGGGTVLLKVNLSAIA